ncbi:MAG: Zn-dependent alcohol dehydrogenase [Actinomycetota bacterium]|nr:Zn-dependent alcohol dehydrogenase [Actinomycetota bacterium]
MRAALHEGRDRLLLVDDVEVEEPRVDEVLVRVSHCGICHSDLSFVDAGLGSDEPIVLGHEAAGTVAAVGSTVTTVAVGDRVMLTPLAPCGHCYWCSRGEPTACAEAQSFLGGTRPDGTSPFSRSGRMVRRGVGVGGFSEFTVVSETGVVRLDPDTPLEIACVIGCAVQTGVGAVVNTAQVEPGATVLVTGLGGIGISVVQGARLAGAGQVIVSDPVAGRRDAALHFGATLTVDPMEDDVVARALEATDGIGVDYAFEAAGIAALVSTCLDATRRRGTTVVVGVDVSMATTEFLPVLLATQGKRIIGTLLGDCHPQRDIPMLLAAWRAGRLDLESMISHRLDLSEVNEGLDRLRRAEGIRTVLEVGGS